jgi:GTP cyclohydrolase II
LIRELARGPLQTMFGDWTHIVYWDGMQQAIAMIYGDVAGQEAIPTRVHSSCITSHVFLSTECDCREQLGLTMAFVQETGRGVVIWLDHEGRANGMMAHTASQQLKRGGMTQAEAYIHLGYPADARRYHVAAEILREQRVISITVLTNNPLKVEALRAAGLPIVKDSQRVQMDPNNPILRQQYLDKIAEGHMIQLQATDKD